MGVTWSSLELPVRASLSEAVVSLSHALTQQGLSNTFWALQEMGMALYTAQDGGRDRDAELARRMRGSLSAATLRLSSELSPQSYSTLLYSMAMMGCQYQSLDIRTRAALESSLVRDGGREGSRMGAKETSMALYGMAKMNLMFESLSSRVREVLLTAVSDNCGEMDEQELGNTVWALSHVGHGIRGQAGEALLSVVAEKKHILRRQSLLAVLQGVGTPCSIGLEHTSEGHSADSRRRWADLPEPVRDALFVTLTRLLEAPLPSDNASSGSSGVAISETVMIGTSLYWLGRLQANYFDLPAPLRSKLISHIDVNRHSKTSSASRDKKAGHPVVLALNGIASMGATWSLLEAPEREVLQSAVAHCLHEQLESLTAEDIIATATAQADRGPRPRPVPLTSREVSSLLWSMGRMGLQIGSLCPPTDAGSVSVPVEDTESMLRDKDPSTRRTSALERHLLSALELAVPTMAAYEVAWCLWALARMGFIFPDLIAMKRPLGSLLLLAINRHIADMAERELGIVLWVCHCNVLRHHPCLRLHVLPSNSMSIDSITHCLLTPQAVGRLQYPVNDFPLILRESLYQGIENMVAMKLGLKKKGGQRQGQGRARVTQ
jgi:hypothetical protein